MCPIRVVVIFQLVIPFLVLSEAFIATLLIYHEKTLFLAGVGGEKIFQVRTDADKNRSI